MQVRETSIPGVLVFEPKVFADARGQFHESYVQRAFDEAVGAPIAFVQDNQSHSVRGVLRGLHYQLPPHAQGKLVRVVAGAVWDVAVDLRRSSPTFGRWVGMTLSAENRSQLWIPPGLAHGFLVLGDSADVLYKTTAPYAPASEACIRWDDAALAIDWPAIGGAPIVSPKDAAGLAFADAPTFA